jgi:four helix bundle protein
VKSGEIGQPADIRERTFDLSVRLVKLCRYLEDKPGVGRTLGWQLLPSGTSIGANVEEAQAGQSRADFISKNLIALMEAGETDYWLRLLVAAQVVPERRISGLRNEVEELKRILGAIVISAKKNTR